MQAANRTDVHPTWGAGSSVVHSSENSVTEKRTRQILALALSIIGVLALAATVLVCGHLMLAGGFTFVAMSGLPQIILSPAILKQVLLVAGLGLSIGASFLIGAGYARVPS